MQYEQTAVKNNTTEVSRKILISAAKRLSTPRLIWVLIVRHKVGLLISGNILLVLNWALPAWPEIVKSFL